MSIFHIDNIWYILRFVADVIIANFAEVNLKCPNYASSRRKNLNLFLR